ncbi:MAG TPA: RagB/SusD family nutrient uptake outer membrane protein [Bacteroidales bacterium]|jgi:hypothetical protein|nr:RagB/SusD family nutrient uptake outer membrane protein [Bacteroidales bacterium]
MKRIFPILLIASFFSLTACSDWLEVLPNNEQVTGKYWKSKEDVEAVLASGYLYMRESVPTLIRWGELRGGTLYSNNNDDTPLQDFNMVPTEPICDYSVFYKIINMANSVLKYAPAVKDIDDTYHEAVMRSHLVEAYFLRAFSYFQLVRNYQEVPLVLEAYVTDEASYVLAKSDEATIVDQIKDDLLNALASGAAKETFEETWQTKGRATKWALYALMADVCLWDEDYDRCIAYSDSILTATAAFRPVFMQDPLRWFEMFYPGNSNESILELNWDNQTYGQRNNFGSYFALDAAARLKFTETAMQDFKDETALVMATDPTLDGRWGRTLMATYVHTSATPADYDKSAYYFVWKYKGTDVADRDNMRNAEDANFILYRVAEIMLMKAEALVMKGEGHWDAALAIINQLRTRASLPALVVTTSEVDELDMLMHVLHERQMEFVAEGKRWYDLLRFGRLQEYKYKEQFINLVVTSNQTTNPQWIRSVLKNEHAWFMPIPYSETQVNPLLKQNPYYANESTN